MAYLTAAVVLVGALCFLDLLLTFAIIRRLRQQLDNPGIRSPRPASLTPAPGTEIAAFTAVTTDIGVLVAPQEHLRNVIKGGAVMTVAG